MDASELKEYIGKTVNVVETPWKVGKYKGVNCSEADGDETLNALRKEIGSITLRLWFPGSGGTLDYRPERINVHIQKEANGNGYHITRISNG